MQQQHPPVVLNPFRTPNQQLHHHLQHQRNVNGKDGTNGIMVVNSWIENPILRICYIMGITMLLICLLMVGYEAYRKSSLHVIPHNLGPHQFSAAVTPTATNPDVVVPIPPNDNTVMTDFEDTPEKIILPEILYKIPPKVARMGGRHPGLRSSSSTASDIASPPQENKKNGEQSVHHDDDELFDEDENEVDMARHVSHDSTTNTDDNVEQILRPKEVHAKLLGMAAKDFMQSAIQEEEQNNFHGFGEDIVVVLPVDGNNTQPDKGAVTTTTTTVGHAQEEEEDMDRVVVVLPPRKGEEFVKSSLIDSKNNNNNNDNIMENATAQQQPLPVDISESKQESSSDEKETLIATTVTIERSRRLRHHVVAIPTPPRT